MMLSNQEQNGKKNRLNYKWTMVALLSVVLLILLIIINSEDSAQIDIYMEPQEPYFEVEVKPSSFSKLGMTLTMKNKGEDCSYRYGEDWGLNCFVNGTWQEMEGGGAVPAIGYDLLPGKELEYEVQLAKCYGTLPAGRYQFVKGFTCIEYFPLTLEEILSGKRQFGEILRDVYVYVEFEVD